MASKRNPPKKGKGTVQPVMQPPVRPVVRAVAAPRKRRIAPPQDTPPPQASAEPHLARKFLQAGPAVNPSGPALPTEPPPPAAWQNNTMFDVPPRRPRPPIDAGYSGPPFPLRALSASGNQVPPVVQISGNPTASAGTSPSSSSGDDPFVAISPSQVRAMQAELAQIRTLLEQMAPLVTELQARAPSVPGIGHNRAPEDAEIPPVTVEHVTAAIDVTTIADTEISGGRPRRSVLRLCGYVLKSLLQRIDKGLSTLTVSALGGMGGALGVKIAAEIWPKLQPLVQDFLTHLQPLLQ